jgi:hypothetical protein
MLPLAMVSATELQSYRVCRRRWQYDRDQICPAKTIPTALWTGSACHKALERYYGNNRTPEDLMGGFKQGVDEQIADLIDAQGFCREAVMTDVDANYGYFVDLLMAYEAYDKEVTQPPWEILETERRYHLDLGPDLPVLTGQIDLLVRINGQLFLVDHKVYSRAPDKRSLHLDTQITAYHYLVWKAHGEFPAGAILNVLIRKKPTITLRAPKLGISPWQGRFTRLETNRSPEAVESFVGRASVQMRDMVQTVQDPELAYANPSWACPSCSYYDLCLDDLSGATGEDGLMPWEGEALVS